LAHSRITLPVFGGISGSINTTLNTEHPILVHIDPFHSGQPLHISHFNWSHKRAAPTNVI
jgi:hypothetical protein